MSVNVAAYVEKKNSDGKWELVCRKPISSRLKYIFPRYNEFTRLDWDGLSDGMKEMFKKNEDGEVYASFYYTSVAKIEDELNSDVKGIFTKFNMIVKALGCERFYDDEGEELEPYGDESGEKLTFPINKELVNEIQYALNDIRNVGQKEIFDLIVNEYVDDYGAEYRIVFVAS